MQRMFGSSHARGWVVAFFALIVAAMSVAQTIPPEIAVGTLYEGELTGTMRHTARVPERGTWALYLGAQEETLLNVRLPNGQRIDHRYDESFANFLFFEVGRPGEVTLEFEPTTESFGEFYAFVLAPATDLAIDEWGLFDLMPAPVDGAPDVALGLGIYRIRPSFDALVELEIQAERYEVNARTGGPGSVSLEYDPYYRPSDSDAIQMGIAAAAGNEYGLILIMEPEEGSVREQIEISVSTSELVRDEPEELRFGDILEGAITPGSGEAEGRLSRPYYYDGTRGEQVAILLESIDFDTYLLVRLPSGDVRTDDDGAWERNSLVILTLPETGRYEIFASSFSGSSTGDFAIRLTSPEEADAYVAEVQGDWGWDDYEEPVLEDRIVGVTTLVPGSGASGTITEDGSVHYGTYVAVFDLVIEDPTGVQIDLTSDVLDTFLRVEDPDGVELSNDDGGEGTNSRLLIPNAFPGTYRVYAGSWSGYDTGLIAIDVTEFAGGPRALNAPGTMMGVGDSLAGAINASSPVYEGKLAAVYEFVLEDRTSVAVEVSSDDFDTYLYVQYPDRSIQSDDDGGEFTNSRLVLQNASPGVYRVYVSSFGGQEQGSFDVELNRRVK